MKKNNLLKLLALALVVCMILPIIASCSKKEGAGEYTYRSYSTSLGNNWNPHTWETNADDTIQGYISSPFCTMSIKDSENGIYQWVYEMATSITDVTAAHQDDLTKYASTLPAGKTASDVTAGYVFEIKLNPDAKWENGTPINADSYIYSMKQLLDPKMRNYRANLYYAGESAVAGGNKFYNSGAPLYECMACVDGGYEIDLDAAIAAGTAYISATSTDWELYSQSLKGLATDYKSAFSAESLATIDEIAEKQNVFGYVKLTPENKDAYLGALYDGLANLFGLEGEDAVYYAHEALFTWDGTSYGEVFDYDATVGCYKVDDYTIRYVNQTQIDANYFLVSCTSTWLVYPDLYEAGKDTTGELTTTNYCTSKETSMSYGPYKIASYEDGKQVVFVQNENWYGWTKNADGKLVSETNFEVDGKKVQQYQTTKIIIDVMDDATAKQKFLKGELNEWTPSADDLVEFAASSRLYKVDETYTMSFFFDCNLEDLKKMDESKGNTNSVVLSNANFRKAFSLAIDREEWVKTTEGYKPSFGLMNNLYFYNVYEDPNSSYRSSEPAMKAICELYGVEYGAGKAYATLKDAYKSINGFNLTEAKKLMKTACDELVAAGLYTAGADIKIRIGWMKGALDTPAQNQCAAIEKYMNAAVEGSGFGKIVLEPVGSINDRYGDVGSRGEFAIGYGAWGGAAFYPFRNLQVYCDTDQYSLHEGRCWDPGTETFTININGTDETMTWKDWSNALIGTGKFADASYDVKLQVTATLEKAYLEKFYRIPLASSTSCFLQGFQSNYYTDNYNNMYDFGGLRLMKYSYDDAEWADYVSSNNGVLNYQ